MDEKPARALPESDLTAILDVLVSVAAQLAVDELDPPLADRLGRRLRKHGALGGTSTGEMCGVIDDLCRRVHWAMGDDAAYRPVKGYLLDNQQAEAGTRFDALATLFDPGTFQWTGGFVATVKVSAGLAGLGRDARVLDYGCGYGRLMAELSDQGFGDLSGVDISTALIERGRRERPDLDFGVIASPPVVERPPGSFDLVLLFAVLTRVPADEDQRALIAEVRRLPAPGGLLYVSDLLRGSDPRRQGVFTTSDGAVCRHHDAGYLRGLLDGFEIAAEKRIEVATMNGNRAAGMRLLAVRS